MSNSNNAYSGNTTINAGILQATASGALGNLPQVSLAGGAALYLGAPQTIGGLSNSGATGGNVVLNGNALTVGGANNLSSTFAGAISDGAAAGGGLTTSGTGVLVLLGSNTYSGGTTVSAGTLQIGDGVANNGVLPATGVTDNAVLVFANPTAATYGGAVAIGGNGSVIKTGPGRLTLGGSNWYSGPTIISGGTLQMGSFTPAAPAVQNPSFESPNIGSNNYLYYVNQLSAAQKTAFVWTSSGGAGNGGAVVNNSTAWNYTMPYPNGNQAFSLQENCNLSESLYFLPGSYTINWSQASRNGQNNPYYFQLNGVNVNSTAFSDTNTAWTTNSASFTISAAGTYAIGFLGTTTGDASVGLDNISISSNLATGSAQLSASTAVNITASGAAWDLNGSSQTVGSLAGVAGATVLDSGALTTGGNNASTLFAGAISGTGSLTTTGSGSLLILAGSNTYSGGTTITAGTLQLGDGLLSNGSVAGTITNNATLAFANVSAQTFSGVVSGSGALGMSGPGALTLQGTRTYSGGTSLNGGTLILANNSGSVLGSGNLAINGGTLMTSGGAAISGSVSIAGNSSVIAPSLLQGSYGTLSLGGLATGANTTLDFNLGATPSGGFYNGDLIAISSTGALSIAASTNIQFALPPTSTGDYRLLAYSNSSTLASDINDFLLPSSSTMKFSLSATADPGYLDLVVASAFTFSGSATWVSTGGTTWNNGSNWQDNHNLPGVPGTSLSRTADTAAFSGSGSVTAITLDTPVSLAALSFSNSNYTLSRGSLTMNASSGTATVTVTSGTQAIASAMEISGGNLAVVVSNSGVLGISGNISDDGDQRSLTLSGDGSGQLILSGTANSYSGGTNVDQGTLYAEQ